MKQVLAVERRTLMNAANPHSIFNVTSADGLLARSFQVPERRQFLAPSTVELETRDDGESPVIRGHAAVFDRMSEDLGGFREMVARGAFRKSLDGGAGDCRCLFNHDPNLVLASVHNNTLDLREDPQGLHYYASPVDTSYARDVRELIRRGDVHQSSFAFTVERDRWEVDENDEVVRTILEIRDLYDVSPVTYPAYPQTDVSARELSVEPKSSDEEPGTSGVLASVEDDEADRRAREVRLREMQAEAKRRLALA